MRRLCTLARQQMQPATIEPNSRHTNPSMMQGGLGTSVRRNAAISIATGTYAMSQRLPVGSSVPLTWTAQRLCP